ncbi:MAG: hypothetical protein IPJ77_11330 [Planctomycetes bacterium]|nr:hypothetical protein [Planctomycetota bacterium]
MGKKKRSTTVVAEREQVVAVEPEARDVMEGVAVDEAAVDAVPMDAPAATNEDAPPKRSKRKAKEAHVGVTLAQTAEGYLRSLEDAGKSQGTVFSYRLELVMALSELGAETAIADLTTERVQAFFESDRVCKTRTGVEKARVSVLKTRRVVRQMLQWAEGAGLVEKAPVPEETKAA